jgi:hypothetical protein
MKARYIVGHIFFAWVSFLSVLIGFVGVDEYGSEWLWIGMFFTGTFCLGFQARVLYSKIVSTFFNISK